MDAFYRPECLPGTRSEILQFITDWCLTPAAHGDQNVLWLSGPLGSGKSTISTTIAERFRELHRLGAFIFFTGDNPTSCDPAAVVRTLAHQLSIFDAHIGSTISKTIESFPRIGEASIRLQFANLLVEPLLSFAEQHTQGPVVIVFDAIDECGNPQSRKELVSRLAEEFAKFPPMFRILVTGRAEVDIEAAFANKPNVLQKKLDVRSQSSEADIVLYLRHRMAIIQKNSIFGLPADWPGPQRIQALADQSAGLFVWASTAATFIEDGHSPEARLGILLSSHARCKAESALDALYATALATAGKWDDETFVSGFQDILGIILVARTPLSDLAIDEILGLRGDSKSQFTLTRLTCLLHWRPGKLIRILHTSIADYLSDSHRCGKSPWFIDTALHGRNLALACLRIMKSELRFNICKFKTSHLSNNDIHDQAIPINTAIGDHLSYSCRFWADHVQALPPDDEILEEVKDFIYTRLLYWLEVMSLVKAVGMASPALLLTSSWLKVSNPFIFPLLMELTTTRIKTVTFQLLLWMQADLSRHSRDLYHTVFLIFTSQHSHLRP